MTDKKCKIPDHNTLQERGRLCQMFHDSIYFHSLIKRRNKNKKSQATIITKLWRKKLNQVSYDSLDT